jgi:nucleotide-binding universal stress UspA family protein
VTFVHFYWPPQQYHRLGLRSPELPGEFDLQVTVDLRRHLERRIGRLPGEGKTTVVVKQTWARFGDAVADAASELRADIVVAGTHQWRGLDRVRHESTSRELLRAVRLPVICIPGKLALPMERRPLPAFRQVLVPTDLSEASNRAIPYAYALIREMGGAVELLHVVEAPSPNGLSPAERRELEERMRGFIPSEARDLGLSTRVTIVERRHAAEAIVRAAEGYDVDAICMSSQGRTGVPKLAVGSVAQDVLERSRRPVIIVREPKL